MPVRFLRHGPTGRYLLAEPIDVGLFAGLVLVRQVRTYENAWSLYLHARYNGLSHWRHPTPEHFPRELLDACVDVTPWGQPRPIARADDEEP